MLNTWSNAVLPQGVRLKHKKITAAMSWLLAVGMLTTSVAIATDEIIVYYATVMQKRGYTDLGQIKWLEDKDTGVAQEGTSGLNGAVYGTSNGGSYNTDSIGYFGALWFWMEYETGCTDASGWDHFTQDDGLGGQAYGAQFDLLQGSLQEFLGYCLSKDPEKWSMFKGLDTANKYSLYAKNEHDVMPTAWHAAFNKDKEAFIALQKEFLMANYSDPVVDRLESKGYTIKSRAQVIRGALLSYAHQHGTYYIQERQLQRAGITNADSDAEFIKKLYAYRIQTYGYFDGLYLGSRYEREVKTALALLEEEKALMNTSSGTHAGDDGVDKPFDGTFIWPTPSCTTTSSVYGWRIHPIYGTPKFHAGEDIPAQMGADILAAASGVVASAGWVSGYGNYTVIDHGQGMKTAYAHQSSILVKAGQTIKQGQLIGYVGTTGNSTGPHLHFEVYKNGETLDPKSFF